MTTDQTINKTSTIRSARRPSPRPLTTRHSLMRFVTALALALSLVGLPSSPAQADSSPVEFEIISVTVTGPVVRVRFEVPGSCWGWNLNRTSIGNTRIVLAIPAVYKGSEYSICPKESFFSTTVFELTNDITELSDNKGKILWSRPGVADFKLRTGKAGTRALKAFVIYEKRPLPFVFEYYLSCKNGYTAIIRKRTPKEEAIFRNLKIGTVCTISFRGVFNDSSIVNLVSKPLRVTGA